MKNLKNIILLFLLFFNYIYANEEEIITKLKNEFLNANENLEIESIDLKVSTKVDMSELHLKEVQINKPTLRRDIGTFKVIFEKDGKEQSVFYRYKIVAKVPVVIVNKDLKKGSLIYEDDIVEDKINFKYTPYEYITNKEILQKSILKSNVKSGNPITKNMVNIISDVKKGSSVLAILKEGAITINFEATALNDGYIGGNIKIRNSNGVVFNGKITSKHRVEIE